MGTNRSKTSVETYNKAAKQYQKKVMDMDLYNDTYDQFCALIDKKNPEVLEVGCGPGNVTKYLYDKRADLTVLAIDLAPNMIALAKTNAPKAKFKVMDCRDVAALDQNFDAILCGFCMPYLSRQECGKMIADFSKLLRPNGVLYCSTMEGDYDKSGYETTSFSGQDQVYIYYHQEDFLTDCLLKSGLQISAIYRKDCREPDGRVFTDMIFLAKKT